MNDKLLNKLASGRFWLTIISGVALIILIVTKQVTSGEVLPIIAMVFISYFNKQGGDGAAVKV